MAIAKTRDHEPVASRIYPVRATPTMPGIAAPVLLFSNNTRDVERDTEKNVRKRYQDMGRESERYPDNDENGLPDA